MTYTKDYKLQLDGFSLFLFIMGFTSLVCLLSINSEFVPTMLVVINTFAWGMFGKVVKVE
mgnify:FL=1